MKAVLHCSLINYCTILRPTMKVQIGMPLLKPNYLLKDFTAADILLAAHQLAELRRFVFQTRFLCVMSNITFCSITTCQLENQVQIWCREDCMLMQKVSTICHLLQYLINTCTSGYTECITLLKENGSAALNKPWRDKRITFDKRLRSQLDICFCMSLSPINVKLGHVLVSHFLQLNSLYTSAGA